MERSLSRLTKLTYGFGDTGFSMTSTIIAVYFVIFMTDVIGILFALFYPLSRESHQKIVADLEARRKAQVTS